MKSEPVPVLSPPELSKIHFEDVSTLEYTTISSVFHINKLEDYRDSINFPLPPHRKTVFDFIFLTKGNSQRSKGLTQYVFEANTFFFLPAYQITTHEYMSPDAEGFYCHFDMQILNRHFVKQDFLKEFSFLQFISQPIVTIENEAYPPIINILTRLENEYKNDRPHRLDLIGFYLLALFVEVKRFVKSTSKTNENAASRITQQYEDALAQHVYDKQNVSEYAELLAVSPNHLNKCVKSATGKSAHDLLEDMILLEAKVLLKQTTLSISEISYKVSKQDPSNFGRFFKAKTGLTPKEYRLLD